MNIDGKKELLAVYEQEYRWSKEDLNRAIQKAVKEGRDPADCWIVQSCFSDVKLREIAIKRYKERNNLR